MPRGGFYGDILLQAHQQGSIDDVKDSVPTQVVVFRKTVALIVLVIHVSLHPKGVGTRAGYYYARQVHYYQGPFGQECC